MATLVEQARTLAGATVRTVAEPSALCQIHDPKIALVIWDRGLKTKMDQWVAGLPLDRLPTFRLEAVPLAEIEARLEAAAGSEAVAMASLLADIADLARLYGGLMGARLPQRGRVRVRLEVVTTDACSIFHVDRVRLRLLTTYLGPGTDWLDTTAPADSRVRRFPPAAVGLLRGSLWPASSGCLQRSPPISGTGRHRLLLAIDEDPRR